MLAALAELACPGLAHAEEDALRACVAAHADGQLLKNQGRLLAARGRFAECMVETCPAIVRDDCTQFERAVAAALPSVIFGAIDETGQPTSKLVVNVDDSQTPLPLDGRPVSLEPGERRVRFRRADGATRDMVVVLAEGERDRRVVADFRPPAPHVSAEGDGGGPRTAILVSGGVAALALGGFTYFALSGRAIQSDLEDCKPNCQDRSELDRMHSRYLLADVSLGVAALSLGVGAYVWLKNPSAFAGHRGTRAPRFGLALAPGRTTQGVFAYGEF